jgi:hypothetical protein
LSSKHALLYTANSAGNAFRAESRVSNTGSDIGATVRSCGSSPLKCTCNTYDGILSVFQIEAECIDVKRNMEGKAKVGLANRVVIVAVDRVDGCEEERELERD